MPIILAIWEAEIQRIVVQGQPGQIVHKTQRKMDWRCVSNKKTTQSPEFKPQSHQKNERFSFL
jgi:hypothetical protein